MSLVLAVILALSPLWSVTVFSYENGGINGEVNGTENGAAPDYRPDYNGGNGEEPPEEPETTEPYEPYVPYVPKPTVPEEDSYYVSSEYPDEEEYLYESNHRYWYERETEETHTIAETRETAEYAAAEMEVGTWGDGYGNYLLPRYIELGSLNGYPLTWRVLEVFKDRTAMLLLNDLLQDEDGNALLMAYSDVQEILGGTEYGQLLAPENSSWIDGILHNIYSSEYETYRIPRVFLISAEDAKDTRFFIGANDRAVDEYWWLQSEAGERRFVNLYGEVMEEFNSLYAIRPALTVDLSHREFSFIEVSHRDVNEERLRFYGDFELRLVGEWIFDDSDLLYDPLAVEYYEELGIRGEVLSEAHYAEYLPMHNFYVGDDYSFNTPIPIAPVEFGAAMPITYRMA